MPSGNLWRILLSSLGLTLVIWLWSTRAVSPSLRVPAPNPSIQSIENSRQLVETATVDQTSVIPTSATAVVVPIRAPNPSTTINSANADAPISAHRAEKVLEADVPSVDAVPPPPAPPPPPVNALGSVAIAILAHDRLDYFPACLQSVLAARNSDQFTVAISMDSPAHFESFKSLSHSTNEGKHPIEFWEHVIPTNGETFPAEAGITRHLKVLFDKAFQTFEFVIVLEDDLVVSPDFFEFFQATGHVLPLSSGSGIYCVSAWNDQALKGFILDESRVMRTSFYPGLGVMFHRTFWVDAMDKEWPFLSSPDWGYDWWIRRHSSVKTKDCIIPEMPRTHHIARHGIHVDGSAAVLYLSMPLASGNVGVSAESVAIAADEAKTRKMILDVIRSSKRVDWEEDLDQALSDHKGGSIVIYFKDVDDDYAAPMDQTPPVETRELKQLLNAFGLFPDGYRSFFHQAFTFSLADDGGITTVTLVGTSMAAYWAVEDTVVS